MTWWMTFAEQLEESSLAVAVHESFVAYPLIEGAHLLGLAFSVGLLAIIDVRLIGVGFRNVPSDVLLRTLRPWMLGGFVATFGSGLVLFATSAVSHITSPAFLAKLVFMGLAALNALWFEFTVVRGNSGAEIGSLSRHARLAGIFSLTLWALVIVTGRLIAYFPGSPV